MEVTVDVEEDLVDLRSLSSDRPEESRTRSCNSTVEPNRAAVVTNLIDNSPVPGFSTLVLSAQNEREMPVCQTTSVVAAGAGPISQRRNSPIIHANEPSSRDLFVIYQSSKLNGVIFPPFTKAPVLSEFKKVAGAAPYVYVPCAARTSYMTGLSFNIDCYSDQQVISLSTKQNLLEKEWIPAADASPPFCALLGFKDDGAPTMNERKPVQLVVPAPEYDHSVVVALSAILEHKERGHGKVNISNPHKRNYIYVI